LHAVSGIASKSNYRRFDFLSWEILFDVFGGYSHRCRPPFVTAEQAALAFVSSLSGRCDFGSKIPIAKPYSFRATSRMIVYRS
jgi:hypothetical protein